MKIQESGEMYLETILILSRERQNVRSIDIVDYMGFSKPSVSRAVGLLKSGGYINVDEDGYITLTELGLDVATKIYERHNLLTKFLITLGVNEATASSDACKIEHTLSEESMLAIKNFIDSHE